MHRTTLAVSILLLVAACQTSEPYTVQGYVRTSDGDGLPAVEIRAAGVTGVVVHTDRNGRYSIEVDRTESVVAASKPGWSFSHDASGLGGAPVSVPQDLDQTVTADFTAELSPQGTIAFVSDRTGDYQIHVMDADGGNVRQLTTTAGGISPSIGPDGRTVVFERDRRLWTVPVSGGRAQLLADDCVEARIIGGTALQNRYLNTSHGCRVGDPAYSQTGEKIAYWFDPTNPRLETLLELPPQPVPHLFVMDADGTDKALVLHDEPHHDRADTDPPAWSPEDTALAFTSFRLNRVSADVLVTDLSGNVRRLADLGGDASHERHPDWAPGEERIYLSSDEVGGGVKNWNVWFHEPNNTPLVGLEGDPGADDLDSAVAPDGGFVAFMSDRDGDWDLFITDRAGRGLLKITHNSAVDGSPDWR